MEKFTPYEKLSKKKKRELDAMKRRDWGGLRPVTRRSENPKAYNRKKAQNRRYDPDTASFVLSDAERAILPEKGCFYDQKKNHRCIKYRLRRNNCSVRIPCKIPPQEYYVRTPD
jgi:hypothetical protein